MVSGYWKCGSAGVMSDGIGTFTIVSGTLGILVVMFFSTRHERFAINSLYPENMRICVLNCTEFVLFPTPLSVMSTGTRASFNLSQNSSVTKCACDPASSRARHGCLLPTSSITYTIAVDSTTYSLLTEFQKHACAICDSCDWIDSTLALFSRCKTVWCFFPHFLQLPRVQSFTECPE